MVVLPVSERLSLSPSVIAAAIVGGVAALAAMLLPEWRFQALVVDSGLPSLLPAAAPPLGLTARAALILFTGGLAGGGTYLAAERLLTTGPATRVVPRRADAHPDAPMREPVKAMRELGTPFLDAAAPPQAPAPERDLPRDLDTPLAVFDPGAIPDTPMTPSAAVAPLFRTPAPAADEQDPSAAEPRIEVFEFTPPVRPVVVPVEEVTPDHAIAAPMTDATIHALLERLERGVRRAARGPMVPRGELDAALATLKRFAAVPH